MGGAVGDWTAKPEIILEAIEYAIKGALKQVHKLQADMTVCKKEVVTLVNTTHLI